MILYNLSNLILWSLLGVIQMTSPIGIPKIFVSIVQSLAILEPIFILLNWVKSSLFTTLIQVASRLLFAWWLFRYPGSPWGYFLLTWCWIITEVIRSCYYIITNKVTKYLRYTAFILLYPLGVLGELMYMLSTLDDLSPVGCITLTCIMSLYIPFFPYLYFHMLNQRKKKLINL